MDRIKVSVRAKKRFEIFCAMGMTGSGLRQHLTRPLAGLTLFAFSTATAPLPVLAQLPTIAPTAPTGSNSVPSAIAPVAQAGASRSEAAYTLGSGDRLRVDVFNVPEYSGEFQVLVNGTLNLPVVGSVSVQGLTIESASNLISSRYARYVRRPIVTLSLLAPRPVTIAVAGEIKRPGTYTVPITEGNQFPTVTQVITQAGGTTLSAEVDEVEVRRRGPNASVQVININLGELLRSGNLSQDITLRDGDTIFIPTVTAVNPEETRQLADASFAARTNEPINVAVVGQVGRPGPYSVSGGGESTGGATGAITGRETGPTNTNTTAPGGPPTVTKAIQVAGGITSRADIRSITIRRPTRSGEPRLINVNLFELLRAGDLSQDVILQDGDTIDVPIATASDPAEATELASASFSPNTIVVNVVGEVEKPGAIPVPPNTPLNQAILAAGGFNNRARKSRVGLVRLNPNGTVEKREIEVDLAQGINAQNNPTLQNNDVVVVNRSGLASFTDTLGSILSPVGGIFSLFNFLRIFR